MKWILNFWKKWKEDRHREREFKRKLEELKKRDPFVYKH